MIDFIEENRYRIALGLVIILVLSIAIFVIVYRDSTELRGCIRYKKINTTEVEYNKMKVAMESYVVNKLTIDNNGVPDVAIAPTIISDDTYTHFSTDKDKIKIEVKPDSKGKSVEQLKLENLIFFEDSLLGIYINEKGTLRAVMAELNKGKINVYTSDNKGYVVKDRTVLVPIMNSEARLDRDLRSIVKLKLMEDKEHKLTDKYFNNDSKAEFNSVTEQVKKSLIDNKYDVTIKLGKYKTEDLGKDRVYMRIYNIGIDNGVVDMILKLDSNNQIFDIDVL